MRKPSFWMISLLVSLPALAAEDGCGRFSWDVKRELALFGGDATDIAAGSSPASAPSLETDRLYKLTLTPQEGVQLAAKPEKAMLADGASAGLGKFTVPSPGTYRVAVDGPFWIDVVDGSTIVPSTAFQGARGCEAPHKIVEFQLQANRQFFVQLSGATQTEARVSITASSPQ